MADDAGGLGFPFGNEGPAAAGGNDDNNVVENDGHGRQDAPLLNEEVVNNTISDALAEHPTIIALQQSNLNFLITDPRLPGNPIIYANQSFLDFTGYSIHEVHGRNCRFMQGPATDPVAVSTIRRAIDNEEDVTVCLLNYKRDGTTFWNRLMISAIRDGSGEVANFVGVQCEVPSCPDTLES